MQKTASGVQKSMGKGMQGGTGFQNVGYQVQDIAVQLQMGTNAAVILAQQGSQIASGFGAAGIAVGATVAVVGGLYTAGDKSNEMFEEMIKNVGKLKTETDKLSKSGGLTDMINQSTVLQDAQTELLKSIDKLYTLSGRSIALLGQAAGGDSPEEKRNKLAELYNELLQKRRELVDSILLKSGEEVNIARMRAEGNEDAADELERQLDLKLKIAKIKDQPFSDAAKIELIEDETKKSDFEAQAKKRIKYEKEITEEENKRQNQAEEMAQAQERFADAQLERITDTETGQEKINRLTSEMNQLLDEAAKHSASSVESINAATEAQRKENEILREKTKLQEEANKNEAANRQFMDDFRARRQKVKADEAEKIAQEQQDQADFMKDFRFNRAVLREKGEREKEQEQGMQSAFDGKRRTIKGYTGGSKSGEPLTKDTGLLGGGTFNEFFKPTAKQSAVKNASITNTRMHQASAAKPEEKLLADIRDGINQLVAI